MRKACKKILWLSVIIICGFWYMTGNSDLELENTNIKGIDISLNDKDKLVQEIGSNGDEKLLLVNEKYGLNKNYIPEGLCIPNIPFADESDKEEKHVAGVIVKPLEELINTAKEDGIILLGNSGYRSYKSQEKVYISRVKSEGRKLADAYVAKPGSSEHQTGLCIDITNEDRYFVEGTKEADWLAENCYKFGFIIRYPYGRKNITGIEYEPWHIRYIGKEAAKYIYDNRITLEEYLERQL
ncbi:M15 family metallopeptidase [Clostridium sp. UBA1056]|uniref:M15 family metallopeptidase n=1 Tax=unclassified Clostridium TaxID=2614128 RepID=UPI003216DBCF